MLAPPRFLAALLLASAPAGEDPFCLALGEDELAIAPPALEGRALSEEKDEQLRARWTGRLGRSRVQVDLRVHPLESFRLNEPEDVLELLERNHAEPKRGGLEGWAFDSRGSVDGRFGWIPYAARGARAGKGEEATVEPDLGRAIASGDVLAVCGVLETHAYSIEAFVHPPLPEGERRRLEEDLAKGIAAKGRVRVPAWTEEEVCARWNRDAPDAKVRAELEKPIRTKHYLILTNSSGGALFAKKMEEFHEKVRKVFPFEDRKGERLLPVFLFRTPEQYFDYYAHVAGVSPGDAARSKGHAWRDYYATWYEAPNDPTHLHEATHQITAGCQG